MSLSEQLSELDFTNRFHQLPDDFFQYQQPSEIKNPFLIHINEKMANELHQNSQSLWHQDFCDVISGNTLLEQSDPIACIYAGHQFGHFVPQLGDGRAILLGEIKNKYDRYWELQLKGAGKTPYSRDGDGRAVLRSTIREYLCSEAMAGLDIPTTRSLAIIGSEEEVYRESIENGAIMLRMAPSFIRFGSFELFASRQQYKQLKQLADFVIEHYYPDCRDRKNPYEHLLEQIVIKTAELMAKWQAVGFAHGVMNTDNMSILGLTLDYGPFGFMDNYDVNYICNHSDYSGRYRFGKQPDIAYWNLHCLANALLPLLSVEEVNSALALYSTSYNQHFLELMFDKLGLYDEKVRSDQDIVFKLLKILNKNKTDYTVFFRALSDYPVTKDVEQIRDMIVERESMDEWLLEYNELLEKQDMTDHDRNNRMKKINPKYILRNYIAQLIIEKAEQKDYQLLNDFLNVLHSPFDEHPSMSEFAGHPPDWAQEISVSCSS